MKKTRDSKLRAVRLRRVRRLSAGLVHHHSPVFSADARLVASRHGEGDESCWVISDRKGRVARVLEGPAVGGASFSSDGSLAYGRKVGATSEIWLAGSGLPPRRLLGGDGRLYRDPAYSPCGRYLAYTADDGHDGAALRLWLLDLAQDEHKALFSGVSHPAWSPVEGRIYFQATTVDGSAIFAASPATLDSERITHPGQPVYRRPAPLAPGLMLCERDGASPEAESQIILLDHRPGPSGEARSEVRILGENAREPAVAVRKKGDKQAVLIAWTMPCRSAPDEPSRFDLHIGRLAGLPALPVRGAVAPEPSQP